MRVASLTTVITLSVTLVLPDHDPIRHSQVIENLNLCWAMARELVARAEDGPLKLGGSFTAACKVTVQDSIEH